MTLKLLCSMFAVSTTLSHPSQYQHQLPLYSTHSHSQASSTRIGIVCFFNNHTHTKSLPILLNHAKTIANSKPNAGTTDADMRKLCRQGQLEEALGILNVMRETGVEVEFHTYVALLQACGKAKALSQGRLVHSMIASTHQESNLADSLVNMYVKCGSMWEARRVFDRATKQKVFLWNVMMLGYVNEGLHEEALLLYYQMQYQGVKSDHYTYPCVLKACAAILALSQGREIHAHVIRTGFDCHVYVENAIVTFYGECGLVEHARQVFDKMSLRDVVSWNAMIGAYVKNRRYEEGWELLCEMQVSGVEPDLATFVSVIPACACLADRHRGRGIHGYAIRNGLSRDVLIGNALIDMYAKCQSINDALEVFENMTHRDVVSWTAMISGYADNHKYAEALSLFHQMDSRGVRPDSVTMSSILSICARNQDLEQGKCLHDYIIRNKIDSDIVVENALLDMYARSKSIENARSVFDKMSQQDVSSWSTMIAGYCQVGYHNDALKLFREMQFTMKPNIYTIIAILPACANIAALQHGKEIHNYIIKSGLSDASVGSQLIQMYVKCGRVEDARCVFDTKVQKSAEMWTAMIAGYGKQGRGKDALYLFQQMQEAGIESDDVTLVAILCACSHGGLVNEGWKYFKHMTQEYNITPNLKHYACMVDLIGRAGFLEEALKFIKEMPIEPDAGVWGVLLRACRMHQAIDLGEQVAKHVFSLEPNRVGYYVLLSSIYTDANRWDGVAKVRAMMKERGLLKDAGCSWIEVNNIVHAFLVGVESHPQADKILDVLDSWATRMKNAGYTLNTNFVLKHESDVTREEDILCGHSEKLAIAFGLISTLPGTPLRITKNVCMCIDCHEATKFISNIVRREISVRDTSNLHTFKNGVCSCGNFINENSNNQHT